MCDAAALCNVNFSRPFLAAAREAGKLVATDVHAITSLDDDYNADFLRAARVVFLTRKGPVPFMGYATGLAVGEMREQVEAVTRFVAAPTARQLDLRRENRVSSLLLAAVPLSLAVAVLYVSIRFRGLLSGNRRTDPPG